MVHRLARARNAKQNAPRARGWSNGRSVVRFVPRFSYARVRTASAAARPHVHHSRAWRRFGRFPCFSDGQNWINCGSKSVTGAVFAIAELATERESCREVKIFYTYTSLKVSKNIPVSHTSILCTWSHPPVTVIDPDFPGNPEIPKKRRSTPPPKQPKMTLLGGWRGRGAHDIEGTSARAREKRETKRATRARVEQREVRGAFCSALLARARAASVGSGAPV